MDQMGSVAAGTIVAKNTISCARVTADSFRCHHPDIPFFVLLADEVDGYFTPERERFQFLRLGELGIPNLHRLVFQYSRQELSYALTPYLLSYLLDRGFDCAAFVKQESLVTGDLTPALARLRHDSILLTPHLLAPLSGSGAVGRELNILLSGVYNGGFVAVSSTSAARQFLAWWQDRLASHCVHAVADGMHFEQRWLDLVPGFFEGVHLLRDPGMNVAHWNLPERDVRVDGETVLVDGCLCRLFRFSGFDPEQPDAVTRYSPRLTMTNAGPAAEVYQRYLRLLEQAGFHETKAWPMPTAASRMECQSPMWRAGCIEASDPRRIVSEIPGKPAGQTASSNG
jgi:hypothetical protein